MQTFLAEPGGESTGPFTDAEISKKLDTGEITLETLARREGMPGWVKLGELPASPPPPPPPRAQPAPDFVADLGKMIGISTGLEDGIPPARQDCLERLRILAEEFSGLIGPHLGKTARTSLNFFSHQAVSTALQRIRRDSMNLCLLTPKGERFVASAAAFLALIAADNWKRRGLDVTASVQFEPGAAGNHVTLTATRLRNGNTESYTQKFLADTHQLLLRPPAHFPWIKGQIYIMDSLTLPPPEYLYLYAVCLMQSTQAAGNWPPGEKVGGLEGDFAKSKQLLVDDLHTDCGLPLDHPGFRQLSLWVVFPPFGWHMNDGQDYNMMTVFSQISHNNVVTLEEGIHYLRALLNCQSLCIRNLAARCLMVYRVPPRDGAESAHYQQALSCHDHPIASDSMAKYQHQLEKAAFTPEWRRDAESERRRWLEQAPPTLSMDTAAATDPDYMALTRLQDNQIVEALAGLEGLIQRYPEDWVLKVLHSATLMRGTDPALGEARLRELIQNPPDCCEGHSRLGTLLKRQGRLGESLEIYMDEVRRWPWNHRAVASCMWLLTEGMTQDIGMSGL